MNIYESEKETSIELTLDLAAHLIKVNEGFKSSVYYDTVGNSTIGYGFNLNDKNTKEAVLNVAGTVYNITPDQADRVLNDLIYKIYETFYNQSGIYWHHQKNGIKAVLIDMAYNLGIFGFLKFDTFLNFLDQKDYMAAAADLTKTLWASQVGYRATRDEMNILANSNTRVIL